MSEFSSAVGLISGGLDSTVVATYMGANYNESHFLFANYGQKTLSRELQAFQDVCDHLQPTSAEVVDLTWMRRIGRMGNSALFDDATVLDASNRKLEYVPFRNANLLAAGVALAETVGAGAVLIGSTGTDRTCPDNSQAFLDAFQGVIDLGTMTDSPIKIVAPLIELDKKGVIKLGLDLNAPFELSWSCHNNKGNVACGGCSNCSARLQGFADLDRVDPIAYDTNSREG